MEPRSRPPAADPRWYQIAVLATMALYGAIALDFALPAGRVALVVASALATQWLGTRLARLPRFDPKSALISALSLCLLLRTTSWSWAAAGAAIAIGSKFTLRVGGRHVFNPTAFALVLLLALTDRVWVSPGQWGAGATAGFLVGCLGTVVVSRAARADVTAAFLLAYAALVLGRAAWLGDPLPVPLHHLRSGSLLLFAFFMISDPKTTPRSRAGRIVFATLVAAGAAFVHFGLYRPNGLLWSLVLLAPSVPVLDRLLPGPVYEWPRPTLSPDRSLERSYA